MLSATPLKRLIGQAYLASPLGRYALRQRAGVLVLHRVVEDDREASWPHRRGMCIGRQAFEHLLIWLRQQFVCVALEELLEQPGGERPRMTLTFDDGWRDNAELAFPLLQRHEIPASIFLPTDFIGDSTQPIRRFWWEDIARTFWQTPQSPDALRIRDALRAHGMPAPAQLLRPENSNRRSLAIAHYLQTLTVLSPEKLEAVTSLLPAPSSSSTLDWAQVRALEDSALVRFGPHGASHAMLTRLDDVSLEAELARSHAALHAHCRHPLSVYCYPHGAHDDRVRRALAAFGYRYALSTQPGLISPDSAALALPRIHVSHIASSRPAQLAWPLFRESTGMRRGSYLWNMVSSVSTRILMTGIRLLRNILLARLLGPADRGLFALLNTLPDLIAALTCGGLNTAVGYQTARRHSISVLLTQLLVYGCLFATLVTLSGVVALRWFGGDFGLTRQLAEQLGGLAWLLLLAVPLAVCKSGLLTLHNADGRVGVFNALRLLESLAPLLLFILFWLLLPSALMAALGGWLIGLACVVAVGGFWLARFYSLRLCWRPDQQKELLHYGARSHPEVLFQQLLLRADYLLVAAILPPVALGHYAMASAAAELLLIIPEAVTTPLMKRLLQQDEGIEELTPLALRLTAAVMFAACAGMAAIGEWLIVTLFGADYAPAYPALLALLPGLFGLCHVSILRLDLLGKQRPGSLSLMAAAAVALNLSLNFWLIPRMGIVGAGIASSVAYLVIALVMLRLYCRLSGVSWARTLFLLPGDVALLRAWLRIPASARKEPHDAEKS
ncbi:MAG: polysaccharide deacetylase family protein [Zoogloeaceae bacterium]|nr:polysaccharide deacetylase family protein [Zoogloeaceae bacterium]